MRVFIIKIALIIFTFVCPIQLTAQVVINEYSASNLDGFPDNYEKYEDWIELYNPGSLAVDLGSYGLSDKTDNPFKWIFPEVSLIPAGGFLRIWASGRNETTVADHLHSNFKLSQTKDEAEHVVLTDPAGTTIDQVQLALTQKEHSHGRISNGAEQWVVFTNPTPAASNNGAAVFERYALIPEMNLPAGFYDDGLVISISTNESNASIRFTLDGSMPTSTSQLYTSPISIGETTIVKAITVSDDPNVLNSFICFNTYFISENHSLAVMSLSAAELDDLLNGNQSLRPFGTFEYFNGEGDRTTFGYGEFNEHGQDSWVHDQRSIDYITRDECGYNYAIREKLIPFSDRNEFQRIILRAAGDDNYPGIDTSAHLRDYFIQNTADKGGLHLDVRKGQKGVVYVNGDYWGVYGFREKVSDHDFTDYYYNQDKYNIYFLKLWGGSWAEYGGQAAFDDWNELHDFIKNQNMNNIENWEYVKSKFDYKSLVDYVHINSFVVCSDWINWNVGWWRGLSPEGGHQKWGYILWDEDATFAHYINYTGVPGISPYTSPCFPEGLTSDPEQHIVVLNKLRANPEFNQYYISRYVDLYNTVFRPGRMIVYLDSIEAEMEDEMAQHILRWGGSMQQWRNNVQKIRNFVTNRHNYLPDGFDNCWNLDGPYPLSINVEPQEAGAVKLNSLSLNQFPFQGDYFGGIEVKLEALEGNPEYEFDYWEVENHTLIPNDSAVQVMLNMTQSENIVAHFKERIFMDSLVINEINYNSTDDFDTDDWVELYNPHLYDLNIEGWKLMDSNDDHEFVFPANTIVESDQYLVLCRDMELFSSFHPNVENLIGEMDFGFSGSGELIRLFNSEGVLIDTVHYLDTEPWPLEPDGNGPTLELILPNYNNALAASWMASPDHGTPGEMNSYWVNLPEERIRTAKLWVVPNPVVGIAKVRIETAGEIENASLFIYNVFGTLVIEERNIQDKQFILESGSLEKGLYLLRFVDKSQSIDESVKIIVD